MYTEASVNIHKRARPHTQASAPAQTREHTRTRSPIRTRPLPVTDMCACGSGGRGPHRAPRLHVRLVLQNWSRARACVCAFVCVCVYVQVQEGDNGGLPGGEPGAGMMGGKKAMGAYGQKGYSSKGSKNVMK